MRHFVLLFVGLLIGAITATILANTLQQRHAYPRGLMRVLQHHLAALRAAESAQRCTALTTHFERIADLADDIPASVYADPRAEPRFIELSTALRDAAAAGRVAPGASCASLSVVLRSVVEACETCHRGYR